MNIIHLVSNRVWGGGERYALDLCCALKEHGHNALVLARKNTAPYQVFEGRGMLAGSIGSGSFFDFSSCRNVAKVLNNLDGQAVIHVHNFKDAATAIKAKRLANRPENIKVVCTRHLVKPAKTDRRHTSIYQALDHIIFVSQLAMDEFMSSKPDVDSNRLSVVHNSIVAPEPAPSSALHTSLICTGRIVPEKGLETLLRAFSCVSNKNIQLIVCGSGSDAYLANLKKLAADLCIDQRVKFAGHVSNIWDEINKADIGIMPSLARESFGLSLLEYMSQGLAVITTTSGAQKEIVTDGRDGILVEPGNVDSLTAAIENLVDNSALCKQLGQQARNTYLQRFAYDKFLAAIINIYSN